MVNRIVVGAHYGLRGWLVQRISAIVIVVYTALAVIALAASRPIDYAAWKALFSIGWMRLATMLFFVSLLLHAWVGMRDILMDYIKPTGLRLALEVLVILLLAVCAGWAIDILWRK
jgi:succinate dehydrogenase / fumarate reductase membrane anchor subunit